MNKNFFMTLLVGLTFCFWHSFVVAMPGMDGAGISVPQTTTTPTPVTTTPLPATTTLATGTPHTTTATLPGIGITATAPVSTLPAQYATEAEINNAIAEAASPNTPLYTETAGGKSKIEIYKVILKDRKSVV